MMIENQPKALGQQPIAYYKSISYFYCMNEILKNNFQYNLVFVLLCLLLNACNSGGDTKEAQDKQEANSSQSENGLGADGANKAEELTAKLEALDLQIEKDTTNADLYFQRSNVFVKQRDLASASNDILKAMELDPENGQYYEQASSILLNINDTESAISMLEKGLKIKPFDETMRIGLAKIHLILKNHPEAMKNLGIVLANNSQNAEAYFYKSLVNKDMGNEKGAIADLEKSLIADPEFYDAYMQIGILYMNKGDTLALKYFKNALRVKPNIMEPRYASAMMYQDLGKFNKAKSEYREIIKLFPQSENPVYNIGWILFQQDSIDLARKHFDIAVKLSPAYANAYHMRGLCSEVLGETEKAVKDYEQALVFKSDHMAALDAIKRLKP